MSQEPAAGTGTATVNTDGTMTYTPPSSTFTCYILDPDGEESNVATVTVTIVAPKGKK